jgi:hypothetical protein
MAENLLGEKLKCDGKKYKKLSEHARLLEGSEYGRCREILSTC